MNIADVFKFFAFFLWIAVAVFLLVIILRASRNQGVKGLDHFVLDSYSCGSGGDHCQHGTDLHPAGGTRRCDLRPVTGWYSPGSAAARPAVCDPVC